MVLILRSTELLAYCAHSKPRVGPEVAAHERAPFVGRVDRLAAP
jgi:hypothetical protein